jgi:protein FrlC
MKYAFNTWCYGSFPVWLPSYPLDEVIRRLARIGYDGIEIGCAAPHAWPAYLSSARRKELRQLMAAENLTPVSLLPAPGGGPGCNPASPLPEERAFTAQHYKDVVDLAADLGAGIVLYVAGWAVYGTRRSEAFKYSLDCLTDVARHAKTRGIRIAVEPTSADSNLIDTADQALELRDACGEANVGVMFDTFHVLYRQDVAADYARIMAPHLIHVHAADTDRKAPGDGSTDWVGFLQALKDIGYAGHVTMETGFVSRTFHPDEVARRGLEHLKAVEASLS